MLAILVASCATIEPDGGTATQPVCTQRGIADAFEDPGDLGMTDIQIARIPDTGQGPGMRVHFRRHAEVSFGEARKPPDLLLAVGDGGTSCTIVVPQPACPQAERIYAELASASIPIGFAFDNPTGAELMHGTLYLLGSHDGHGNAIDWLYYGPGHPLQEQIDQALDALAACAEPAANALP